MCRCPAVSVAGARNGSAKRASGRSRTVLGGGILNDFCFLLLPGSVEYSRHVPLCQVITNCLCFHLKACKSIFPFRRCGLLITKASLFCLSLTERKISEIEVEGGREGVETPALLWVEEGLSILAKGRGDSFHSGKPSPQIFGSGKSWSLSIPCLADTGRQYS